jgi:hypothetical protein
MQIIGFVLLVLFGGISMIALLTAIALLLPDRVKLNQEKLESSLGKSFLLGLVNLLFWLPLGIFFVYLARNNSGFLTGFFIFLGALVLLVLIGLVILGLTGLAAIAQLLGTRIGIAKSPFQTSLHGDLLLVLACLTPYLGWYLFTPAIISIALGASIQSLFQRR